MALMRFQTRTPNEYCNQSRDFQLLCRLCDCVFNNTLFDIETMTDIINTKKCRDNILPLLQTKLGFFTNKDIISEQLRYVLEVFPILVKKKGSISAIIEAVTMYLKIYSIVSPVEAYYTKESIPLGRHVIPDNTVVIGITSGYQDTSILDEVFRYILPIGVGYYFYFSSDLSTLTELKMNDSVMLLFASYNTNSTIRYSGTDYDNIIVDRNINTVNTMNIYSSKNADSENKRYYYNNTLEQDPTTPTDAIGNDISTQS